MKVYAFLIPSYPSIAISKEPPKPDDLFSFSNPNGSVCFGLDKKFYQEEFDYLMKCYTITPDTITEIEL